MASLQNIEWNGAVHRPEWVYSDQVDTSHSTSTTCQGLTVASGETTLVDWHKIAATTVQFMSGFGCLFVDVGQIAKHTLLGSWQPTREHEELSIETSPAEMPSGQKIRSAAIEEYIALSGRYEAAGMSLDLIKSQQTFAAAELNSTTDQGDEVYLEREVHALIQSGDLKKAKSLLDYYPNIVSNSHELQAWNKVIAPPVISIRDTSSGSDLAWIATWLHENSYRYRGQWVAFRGMEMIGYNENRVQLTKDLQDNDLLKDTRFFRVM